ncbi:hypothetical protein Taro_010050 [Colocasia esculenta]|uniref:Uncharacterized protein n=1 Tax=Colocasia esculenta TaxID=4460 RepID=A0A843U6L3_COLES|nr:hypothetical protein [Colocasia esculenta]
MAPMQHETLDHRSPGMPPPENLAPPSLLPGDAVAPDPAVGPSLSRNTSSSHLNAQAPEFVPRTPLAGQPPPRMEPRMVQIHRGPTPPPLPVVHLFHPPPLHQTFHHVPVVQNQFEYYYGWGGGYREYDVVHHAPAEGDPASAPASAMRDGLSEDVIQKVTNQVGALLISNFRAVARSPPSNSLIEGIEPSSPCLLRRSLSLLLGTTPRLLPASH